MPPAKYDRVTILREHDRRRSLGQQQEDIAKDIVPGGMPVGTLRNILYQTRRKLSKPTPPQEPPMSADETPVEVLDGQMELTQHPSPESKPGIRTLPLSAIVLDAGTQMRVELSDVTVTEFAQDMLDGDQFPPIIVFSTDETTYMLADGFHRVQAAKNALQAMISAEVHPGGVDEAIDYACQANIKHGLRPTTADKRKAALIQLERYPERADREIARLCGCSPTTVGNYRRSMEDAVSVQTGQVNHDHDVSVQTGQIESMITEQSSREPELSVQTGQIATDTSLQEPTRTVEVHRGSSTYQQHVPTPPTTGKKTKPPKSFDVQDIERQIKDLYMNWLRHCEDDQTLETAQFFLNTLSDLAQGREMQLHRS